MGSVSSPGDQLLHYRLIRKIGEGGMGVVYEARDTHLDRLVALKLLPYDAVANPARRQRFIQEAKAASALNHPNIVTIYDIASAGGVDYISMELIRGRTLEQLLSRGPLRLTEALDDPDRRRARRCPRGRHHPSRPQARQHHGH
jgi:serine/threonine protein kinase